MERLPIALGLAVMVVSARGAAGELRCEPRWPQFCANVHVACTGHTRLPAKAFVLQVADGAARVDVAGGEADEVLGRYANARAERDEASASLILRPAQGPGYIRLDADGRYSIRHYVGPTGVMSIGTCR